jgi:anthranilate synthase component I
MRVAVRGPVRSQCTLADAKGSSVFAMGARTFMMKSMPQSPTYPAQREFLKLAKTHTLVPVYRTVTADLETPVSAFLRVAAEEPEAFLLESVEGGERVGRYTFIGLRPYKTMLARGHEITVHEGKKKKSFTGDIFTELKLALSEHTPARLPGLPPFTAGAVGFFAYDVVRQIEKLPSLTKDDLHVPDACLMFFDEVMAFDHVKKEIHLIVTADLTRQKIGTAYASASKRLNGLEKRLAGPLPKAKTRAPKGTLKIDARTTKAKFIKAVEKTKEYIAAGDVFQCVLSQRFDCKPGVTPFDIYRALRIVNPSPYMYFLRFPMEGKKSAPGYIVGSSPETLVRVTGRKVEYKPIAGSMPRSENEAEDQAFAEHMRTDAKEVA